MHPVHDVDAFLLLATALAAKRRPAELADILAAIDLLQIPLPAEAKLADAFDRLARHGLIVAAGDGFALTQAAQQIIAGQPKKAENDERLFGIRQQLAAHASKGEHPAIVISPAQLAEAFLAHRTSAKSTAKNLLIPKPKPEEAKQRPGQRQRKPLPARRRKD